MFSYFHIFIKSATQLNVKVLFKKMLKFLFMSFENTKLFFNDYIFCKICMFIKHKFCKKIFISQIYFC